MTSTTSTSRARPGSVTPSTTSTSAPAPGEAAVRAGSAVLRPGHTGASVTALQDRLNRAGAQPVLREDGSFGQKTRAAVEHFQREHGLPVDGKVGANTLAALEAATASTPATPGQSPHDAVERGPSATSSRALPSSATAAPAPTTAPRRGLRADAAALPPLPAGLSGPERTTIANALNGTTGVEARTAVTSLMTSAPFRSLAPAAQERLLSTVHSPGAGGLLGAAVADPARAASLSVAHRANEAAKLLQTTASRTGTDADRGRLVDVYCASTAGRASLLTLAGQQGGPNKLAGRDLRGGTMLTHLATMATAPLGRGINREELLRSTMSEVRTPSTIEQQQQGTCAGTSVTLRLVGKSPAEYVRLIAGVASEAGTTPLANGTALRRIDESITDKKTGRSISERLLQDAFMDVANGSLRYTIATNNGLTSPETSRLESAVFNQPYRSVTNVGRNVAPRDANLVEQAWGGLRNAWDFVTFQHNTSRPMELLRERSGTPTTIAMRWGTTADSNHAVVFTRIESGRVYFQNPHGNAGNTLGESLTSPPRRVEQGNEQSMTVAEFERRLFAVSVPE